MAQPSEGKKSRRLSTHTELGEFYRQLHTSLLNTKVDAASISLANPIFQGVSQELFESVKESYGEKVVEMVKEVAEEQAEDVVLLMNHMLPDLATTLARQRRDYGLDPENFPPQFPVEEQAESVDDCPTNNMDMERLMGFTDQRLKKLQTLPATSRSIILNKTRALYEAKKSSSFRSFREQVDAKREMEVEWNNKLASKLKTDTDRRQEAALSQERKRLLALEKLKESKGPFTNAEEVEEFLRSDISEKEKQKRMKKELTFARDSSITLPRVDPLFKIQVKDFN